ncbi:hypothetical protein H9Q10_07330 [Eikenella sp. S3360]|uniref:Uncharacterized protein n=1 Tax=Eikenella glucosivorans TaxID=2766967 RepID=A0ABS0NB13_9NEIS|nr:hypothetical protein [Eikenella glucosivorans]MBH5329477.1 hypothetical protein [Eikenella glucosivorans]
MNAHLKKLLQNLSALIVLPALGWYITRGGTVNVVDTENARRKGRAIAWLFNEFGTTGVWALLGAAWVVCLIFAVRSYRAWQQEKRQ